MKSHRYQTIVDWSAEDGEGTKDYRSYSRNHLIAAHGKPVIAASSDPAFRGDPTRYNPEELLVASLSSCHMLWYLHLCATNGVTVVEYRDTAYGIMQEHADGSGKFTQLVLQPSVTITSGSDLDVAQALHEKAHHQCFIARSVNFLVTLDPTVRAAADALLK